MILIDEHVRCILQFYGNTIQQTFIFFRLIHKSIWEGIISEKSFKYLHFSEVLSVKQPNTCHGQETDDINRNTMNKTALINTNKKYHKNRYAALWGLSLSKCVWWCFVTEFQIYIKASWRNEGKGVRSETKLVNGVRREHLRTIIWNWQKESRKVHLPTLCITTSSFLYQSNHNHYPNNVT